MKKLLLLFLVSTSASAFTEELCIAEAQKCNLLTYSTGKVYIRASSADTSPDQVAFTNSKLQERGLLDSQQVDLISPRDYAAIKANNKVETYTATRDTLKSNLNMTKTEAAKLISCAAASAFCVGSIASLAIVKYVGLTTMISVCTATYFSCDEAIDTLDEYVERVKVTKALLDQQTAEMKAQGLLPNSSGSSSQPQVITDDGLHQTLPGPDCVMLPTTEVSSGGHSTIVPAHVECADSLFRFFHHRTLIRISNP